MAVPVLSAKTLNTETLAISVQFPFTGLPTTTVSEWFINTVPFQIQFAETDNPSGDLCAEGACSVPFTVDATFAQPHLINTCDLFLNSPAASGNCTSAILHQNGSLVTFASPAAPGEILKPWAVGLGAPSGGIPSGAAGPIAMNNITISLGFLASTVTGSVTSTGETQVANPTYLWAGLPNPSQGLYQINFAIPPSPAGLVPCTATAGNFYVGFGRNIESAGFTGGILAVGAAICVGTN
jgi:uncharacterized protein (TIGR03437 family)